MRVKHARRARKLLTYFRSAHGFKPPYTVLLDGTAIQAAHAHGVGLAEALPQLLGGQVKLVVPRAVVSELHALGRQFAAAAKFARRLKIVGGSRRVGGGAGGGAAEGDDDDDDSGEDEVVARADGGSGGASAQTGAGGAADALADLVADGNPGHYFVLTEDVQLRQRLSCWPSVPLLRLARGRLVLEAPGKHGSAQSDGDDLPPLAGGGGLKRPREEPATGASGDADASPAAPSKKKRKHLKEPNPLSMKKKKKQKKGVPTPPQPAASGGGSQGRRRKRRAGDSSRGND